MLEAVGRLGRVAAAEDQLGGDQLSSAACRSASAVGDRGEQRVGELAAERGADLRDLLDRGEAVEAGEQRVVQRRRDRERRQRTGQLVMVAGVGQEPELEHRLGQLLDEQRHAVGLGHDLRRDLRPAALVLATRSTRAAPSRRPSRVRPAR